MFRKQEKTEILVLCQLFYPELVSTGQTLTELCEKLSGSGIKIEVVCAPPTVIKIEKKVPRNIDYDGIKITRVWATSFPKLNIIGRVINQFTFCMSVFFYLLFDRKKRTILVLTNPPFLAFCCALLRTIKIGSKYIYLIFDVYPDTAIQLGVLKQNGLLSSTWERLNCFIFKHASAIIVIGRCMESVIKQKAKNFGLNLDNKLHHISVWSDDKSISSVSKQYNPLRNNWKLQDKFVVGYFGNMGRFHDMETIIRSAKILKDNKNICFLFVGEGHKKQAIKEYATKHNLRNCQFHTYVPREDLGHLMQLADIGIVSLRAGHEGLSVPSKTFGLMAAGVPIMAVMSPESEIARIVKTENCGILLEPEQPQSIADSIMQLSNNKSSLDQMGKNALKAINNKYNLEEISRKYLDLIEQISYLDTS